MALSMAAVFYLTMYRWFHLVATSRILSVNHSQPWLPGSIQHIKQLTFCLCTEHLWKFKCMMFLLYFSREEKALTFAVRCWNALQLKEVEKDLHLSHDL